MNRPMVTIREQENQKTASYHTSINMYLLNNSSRTGKAFLYRLVHNDFAPAHKATVRFLQIPLDKKNNRVIKRITDGVLAAIVITFVLLWLIPVISVLIKLTSRGPVFFLQKRNGEGGKVFTCIKFRTMYVNDDADLLPATAHDKRITPLGRFMRRTFMDELPQFLNVLWGDMSIVGPRPHMLSESAHFEAHIPYYRYRERIKPGITGLSQIIGLEGRAETIQKMKDRVDTDIFYVRNWSPKLDLVIIYRTLLKLLSV
ncbi:MAG: sugar transferase [Bacteroidetes bacterium]|nr:sugar transferase [Bacteroidota bacterium]